MIVCPANALGRSECAQLLFDEFAAIGEERGHGCEITVSTAPPIVKSPFGTNGYRCDHGVVYWIEPTSEQIAQWNRDGVE